eukprot:6214802-Pleurochrysis_carterae.AAC.3
MGVPNFEVKQRPHTWRTGRPTAISAIDRCADIPERLVYIDRVNLVLIPGSGRSVSGVGRSYTGPCGTRIGFWHNLKSTFFKKAARPRAHCPRGKPIPGVMGCRGVVSHVRASRLRHSRHLNFTRPWCGVSGVRTPMPLNQKHAPQLDQNCRSFVLLYRIDSAAPPNNRTGEARPSTTMELKVLEVATSGRGNYGCVSDECYVREWKLLYNNIPVTPRAYDYTVRTEAKSPLGHGVAMRFGVSTQHANKPR